MFEECCKIIKIALLSAENVRNAGKGLMLSTVSLLFGDCAFKDRNGTFFLKEILCNWTLNGRFGINYNKRRVSKRNVYTKPSIRYLS